MKKIIALFLSILALLSIVSLSACGEKETLKFGLGVYSQASTIKGAEGEADGSAEAVATVAAVLLDKDGKVVKCAIDVADNTVNFTTAGKAQTAKEFKTKYELGDNYGMIAYGGAKLEWYEQADAFVKIVVGKTADEIKKLVASDFKGTDEVINAGCTIYVSDFVKAIDKAIANAADSQATADDTLKLAIVSKQANIKDATEEAKGTNGFETAIAATVLDAAKKVVATSIDTLDFKVEFDAKGATETKTGDLKTKKELGNDYGMKAYGGAKLEWFEQIDALEKLCAGKNESEISKLATEEGKGNSDVQAAGCTITIDTIVKALIKSAQ